MVVKAVKIPYGVGETELVILKKRAIALQSYKGDRSFSSQVNSHKYHSNIACAEHFQVMDLKDYWS